MTDRLNTMTTTTTPPRAERTGRAPQALRSLAASLASPLVPADYLDLVAPLRRGTDLRARVEAVTPLTADAATLLLRPGADWRGHEPGQYVRLGVDVDGVRHHRAYSLTHGPRADGLISVTVKAVADGTVSPYLVHRTRPGTLLHLTQAEGDFVLGRQDTRLLMLTAGSGVTPVIGMLRNLFPVTDTGPVRTQRGRDLDIVVVHLSTSRAGSVHGRDLEQLHEAGAITLISHHDDIDGRFDVDTLARLVPDLTARTTYACGPAPLLDALAAHHETHGLALRTERFTPPSRPAADAQGGAVRFTESGATAESDGATPLLVTGEDAGVLMPSGCRMGICFGCVSPLRAGTVRDLRTGETTTVDGAPVEIQTCISTAVGDCDIAR